MGHAIHTVIFSLTNLFADQTSIESITPVQQWRTRENLQNRKSPCFSFSEGLVYQVFFEVVVHVLYVVELNFGGF